MQAVTDPTPESEAAPAPPRRTADAPAPARFFSLRWKAVLALGAVLLSVNSSLALLAYRELAAQFDAQQTTIRAGQARQLEALVDDCYRQMARLAVLVPLLAPVPPAGLPAAASGPGAGAGADDRPARAPSDQPVAGLALALAAAVERGAPTLDLEWDVRSVHWISPAGENYALWAVDDTPLPAALSTSMLEQPEVTSRALVCDENCRQYLATPLLWQGEWAGMLVLGRSLADVLLSFGELSGTEVAVLTEPAAQAAGAPFPLITHPQRTGALFRRAAGLVAARPADAEAVSVPLLLDDGPDHFEVFRYAGLAPGIDLLVMNRVTEQRAAIAGAVRTAALLGLLGLVLSGGLLLGVMRQPLRRLPRLASLLPLLAERRFDELDARLAQMEQHTWLRDEIDLTVERVGQVAARIQALEGEREQARRDLSWLADHDPLTELLNRRGFGRRLTESIEAAIRDGHSGALLFVDLDQFKDVNDISGHHMGDRLLHQITLQLRAAVGGDGVLGRLGGDEFALLLDRATVEDATALARRAQQRIQSVAIEAGHWRHQVSASIGIVLFPDDGRSGDDLMAQADLAMYQAKECGRGRWHRYAAHDRGRERANARVLWAERINAALATNRFELHLQPILCLASGRVARAEALIRLREPGGVLVLPGDFIALAEETGQIGAIDHWVLDHAIALQASQPTVALSMNLSVNALRDPRLLPHIQQLLATHRVDPARLTFEVTEGVAIASVSEATRLMQRIRALGCRFALDDFGSGFASYAYLRQLPVDDVKIDGAFIRDLPDSREDRIFVRAVTEMAHGMGKRVTAEFVENEAILTILRELDVDYAQGYHIGAPMLPT